MTMRIVPFLLVFCLLAFTTCQETNNTVDDTAAGETMENTQQAIANTAQDVSGEIEGETYRVTVEDGTIKSPRKQLAGTVGNVDVKINYGSPAVNERTIYGDLVPYNKVWRTGANEATRIEFTEPVLVGAENKRLEPGTYALFTLPTSKDEWTIIFNKKADQWGAYDYDEKDDVVKVKGSAKATPSNVERMDFGIEGNEVQMMWADRIVSFPVSAAAK